ncbi:protein-L-isoaspartate(D-aspartate) O-methyltransferase [Aquamicrobium sp. LC103]|nr:protein-L-isoaspartate(D-aspartate) O-methyltransferase [Aquamicrobium sp. LC103]
MVKHQLEQRGISDKRVLRAMRRVPREKFIPDHLRDLAYEDGPLPIEEGQTISQPYIVAFMAEAGELKPGDKVLEIGTGSGYAAAVMAEIAGRVITIERHAALAEKARQRLSDAGYANVDVRTGDGTLGLPGEAPFDAIIATAGGPRVPEAWKAQLAVGGRIVVPVGQSRSMQDLVRLTRIGDDEFRREPLGPVRFVPLIGEEGWDEGLHWYFGRDE